jgi:hypothetical protein
VVLDFKLPEFKSNIIAWLWIVRRFKVSQSKVPNSLGKLRRVLGVCTTDIVNDLPCCFDELIRIPLPRAIIDEPL